MQCLERTPPDLEVAHVQWDGRMGECVTLDHGAHTHAQHKQQVRIAKASVCLGGQALVVRLDAVIKG